MGLIILIMELRFLSYFLFFNVETQERLSDLVIFWTGNSVLPTTTATKLTVTLFAKDESRVLPEANTCPRVLLFSVVHCTYEKFKKAMDTAVGFSKYGFGKM